ncbi:MAG: Stage 0 sporulation protein A [Eubacteriales bacterium SKADARSKE-1]|nr:Stage 0 sporulation protein A [Eubacteriales bacterium SKADARSKE-1]
MKVLIADDNLDVCNSLLGFFESIKDIDVCAVANNGIDAIKEIYKSKPNIVLLDVAMPKSDGIEVLKELKKNKDKFMPQIIMMSAIGQESILKEAFSLGASYYMVKPFKLSALEDRIRLISNNKIKTKEGNVIEGFDSKIAKNVMNIGVPTNILGYKYIVDVLKIMLNNTKHCLLSNIYCTVADKNFTTVQCVESAIRNAIFQAFKQNNANYNLLFSQEALNGDKKPTNSQFLTKLSEHIKVNFF